eukprot:scaffold26890_cov77-Isochrysis_galbana.AAC.1
MGEATEAPHAPGPASRYPPLVRAHAPPAVALHTAAPRLPVALLVELDVLATPHHAPWELRRLPRRPYMLQPLAPGVLSALLTGEQPRLARPATRARPQEDIPEGGRQRGRRASRPTRAVAAGRRRFGRSVALLHWPLWHRYALFPRYSIPCRPNRNRPGRRHRITRRLWKGSGGAVRPPVRLELEHGQPSASMRVYFGILRLGFASPVGPPAPPAAPALPATAYLTALFRSAVPRTALFRPSPPRTVRPSPVLPCVTIHPRRRLHPP